MNMELPKKKIDEHEKYLSDLRQYTKWLLEDESRSRQFFIDAGIHDEYGELTEHYKN